MTGQQTRRAAWFTIGAITAGLVVAVLVLVIAGFNNSETVVDRQKTNLERTGAAAQSLQLLRDCVVPGGKCYQRSLDAQAKAVGTIGKAQASAAAAAAWCAQAHPQATYPQMLACVTKTMGATQ